MKLHLSEYIIRSSVITVDGRIDICSAQILRQQLDSLFDAGLREFVIDLSRIEFIDSSGLAALVSLLKRVRLDGGDVGLILPGSSKARRLFEMTRFDRLFTPVQSVQSVFPASAELVHSGYAGVH